jgi:uncharacterized membrane protein
MSSHRSIEWRRGIPRSIEVEETALATSHWPTALGEEASNRQLHHGQAVPRPQRRNVGRTERDVSTFSGAALLALGLIGPRRARGLALLSGAGLLYRGVTGHCHLYEALGIDTTRDDAKGVPARHGFKYEQSIAVQTPAAELYRSWRNLAELPQIMRHLEQVVLLDDKRSEWVACGPFNTKLRWQAEIFEDRENEMIAWRSIPGGDVDTAGSIHFRPLGEGRGTALQLSLKYDPPGGKLTATLAWLVGQGAEARIDEDLRRFKSRMEAGEAPTTDGQSCGPRA